VWGQRRTPRGGRGDQVTGEKITGGAEDSSGRNLVFRLVKAWGFNTGRRIPIVHNRPDVGDSFPINLGVT